MSTSPLSVRHVLPPVESRLIEGPIAPESADLMLVRLEDAMTRNGLSWAETQEVAIVATDTHLLLATDLDRGITKTVDGDFRPYAHRFRLPFRGAPVGSALHAGCVTTVAMLIMYLRRRDPESTTFDAMSNDDGALIGLYHGVDPMTPAYVVITPLGDGATGPRVLPAIRGIAREQIEARFPDQIIPTLPHLDTETMVELAEAAHFDVGIVVYPQPADKGAPIAAAVGPHGIMVRSFKPANLPADPARPELTAPFVISPRQLADAGFTRDAFANPALIHERSLNKDRERSVFAAAIAACITIEGEQGNTLETIAASVGASQATRAMAQGRVPKAVRQKAARGKARATRTGPENEAAIDLGNRAAQAAEAILKLVPESRTPRFVELLSRTLEEGQGFAHTAARATIDGYFGSFSAIEARRLAHALCRALPNEQAATSRVALHLGRLMLEDAPALMPHLPAPAAIASFATRHTDGQDILAGALSVASNPASPIHGGDAPVLTAWWAAFKQAFEAFGLTEDAQTYYLEHAGEPPVASQFKLPPALKKAWAARVDASVGPMVIADASGKITCAFSYPSVGEYLMMDTAVRPNVDLFPASLPDLRAIQRGEYPAAFRAAAAATDLAHAADAVTALPRLPRIERDRAQYTRQIARSSGTLFVARWSPVEGADPIAAARPGLPAARPVDEVFIGQPGAEERFVVDRADHNRPVDGWLTIYGFDVSEKAVTRRIPLQAIVPTPGDDGIVTPVSFVLDAEALWSLLGFVARKTGQAQLTVTDGAVAFTTNDRSRTSLIRTVSQSEAPEALRAIIAAAGAPVQPQRFALVAPIDYVRALPPSQEPTALVEDGPVYGGIVPGLSAVLPRPNGEVVLPGPVVGQVAPVQDDGLLQLSIEHTLRSKYQAGRIGVSVSSVTAWLEVPGVQQRRRLEVAIAVTDIALGHLDASIRDAEEQVVSLEGAVEGLPGGGQLGLFPEFPVAIPARAKHLRSMMNSRLKERRYWAGVATVAREILQKVRAQEFALELAVREQQALGTTHAEAPVQLEEDDERMFETPLRSDDPTRVRLG